MKNESIEKLFLKAYSTRAHLEELEEQFKKETLPFRIRVNCYEGMITDLKLEADYAAWIESLEGEFEDDNV